VSDSGTDSRRVLLQPRRKAAMRIKPIPGKALSRHSPISSVAVSADLSLSGELLEDSHCRRSGDRFKCCCVGLPDAWLPVRTDRGMAWRMWMPSWTAGAGTGQAGRAGRRKAAARPSGRTPQRTAGVLCVDRRERLLCPAVAGPGRPSHRSGLAGETARAVRASRWLIPRPVNPDSWAATREALSPLGMQRRIASKCAAAPKLGCGGRRTVIDDRFASTSQLTVVRPFAGRRSARG